MTKEEFHEEMIRIDETYGGDPESCHAKADDLMCEALERLGFSGGVKVFKTMHKWYA